MFVSTQVALPRWLRLTLATIATLANAATSSPRQLPPHLLAADCSGRFSAARVDSRRRHLAPRKGAAATQVGATRQQTGARSHSARLLPGRRLIMEFVIEHLVSVPWPAGFQQNPGDDDCQCCCCCCCLLFFLPPVFAKRKKKKTQGRDHSDTCVTSSALQSILGMDGMAPSDWDRLSFPVSTSFLGLIAQS